MVWISRREMAHWTILCTERYLSLIYDCMHKKLYEYHVLQADETPVRVTKENRTEGSKHFMWVYRTGKMYEDRPIILYDYQPSRNLSHPKKFLKDFRGICVTDGYHVETVVKLSLKKDTPKIEVTMEPDEESNYTPEEKATYPKIKEYVKNKYGVNVHTSYIA